MTDKNTQTEETTEYTYPPKHPLVLQNIENMLIYNKRLIEITENSDEYLNDFYNESPNFTFNKEFVNKLIWLTYSDKEKKHMLDKELEEYFN